MQNITIHFIFYFSVIKICDTPAFIISYHTRFESLAILFKYLTILTNTCARTQTIIIFARATIFTLTLTFIITPNLI